MEKLILTDILTSEPKKLNYTSPTLLLFFSLKDIALIKEIQKDISLSALRPISIYIGEEAKKVSLWKQKEQDSYEIFNGGNSLKSFPDYQITEIPSVVLIKNNSLFLSKKAADFEKPLIKSILHRYPEFKKQPEKKQETLEDIIRSKKLTFDEKLALLENLSAESQAEVEKMSKELEDKDRTIKDIVHKLDIFLGNKNRRKRKTKSPPVEEAKIQPVLEPVQGVEIEEDMPKDLWIFSMGKAKPLFPPINARSSQPAGQRSKSIVLPSKFN